MSAEKHPPDKARLHPRNKNRERYDLDVLIASDSELKKYIKPSRYGTDSIDFSDPVSVKVLNRALLSHYYGIKYWDFPDPNLCPPVPGRADYIHYIADLLGEGSFGNTPTGSKITCVDIGVGASCIYPILGVTLYNWHFIGSDVDPKSIASARNIIKGNPLLTGKIVCRLQGNVGDIFRGVIGKEDRIDATLCNPPFHASVEEARAGTRRKLKNLSGKSTGNAVLNFSGVNNELIYKGGEYQFLQNLIRESKIFAKNCYWFSSLVSKQSNLKGIYRLLEGLDPEEVRTIPMATGNKSTRIVAWTFLPKSERAAWRNNRRDATVG